MVSMYTDLNVLYGVFWAFVLGGLPLLYALQMFKNVVRGAVYGAAYGPSLYIRCST